MNIYTLNEKQVAFVKKDGEEDFYVGLKGGKGGQKRAVVVVGEGCR